MISTIAITLRDRYGPWHLSGGGLTVPNYNCKTHPNGARQHYWFWGDAAKPTATEPEPDAKCQCGETTWAEEKAKQGILA